MEMTGKRLKEGITAFFFQNKIKRRHTRIFFGSHYYLYLHLPICSTKRHAQCEHGLQGSNCMYYEYNHPYNGQTNKRFFLFCTIPISKKTIDLTQPTTLARGLTVGPMGFLGRLRPVELMRGSARLGSAGFPQGSGSARQLQSTWDSRA